LIKETESVVSTTTVTTDSPPLTDHEGLTVCQRVSYISVADAVRQRLRELRGPAVRTVTWADFEGVAERTGHPTSWVADHLLVLEGIGILRQAGCPAGRAWTVSPASEYLR
jgi:hypothetical protein